MSEKAEEIKKGLMACSLPSNSTISKCVICPYKNVPNCSENMNKDALAYIQLREHSFNDLSLRTSQLEDHIRDLVRMIPKWISVKDRLPKRNERVVVTDGKHTWDYGQFNGLAFCFNNDSPNPRKWNWKKHTVRHVEWWMPKETALPEPPKEG